MTGVYLSFQEVAGLRQRIGDAMYSLLGNANLQILMRLQEGSETRKYVEQTAGDTHVTQASSFQANEYGMFRESMSADVRQTGRVNWSDLRGLIEGEAIILLGKDRVYAKLFRAEIDAKGPLRMNRPVMLRPPEAGKLRLKVERTRKTLGHLLAGRAAMRQDLASAPILDALIAGFAHRAAERPGQNFGTTAHAAILALREVQPSASEVLAFVVGAASDAETETEHGPMVTSTHAPTDDRPLPDAPRASSPSETARILTEINERFGASPADAQVDTNRVLAMHEAATDEVVEEPGMPVIDTDQLRSLIESLAARLIALGHRPSSAMAAE